MSATHGRSNPWSTGPNQPAACRRWQQARRRARVRSPEAQTSGGGHPRGAGALPHPVQQEAAAGVDGVERGEVIHGGWNSAGCGDAAAVRWESNWWWRWLPAELLSMVTRAGAGCGGLDHGGAMAGGGGLSGSMGTTTMRRNRARGERGTKEELTVGQTSGSVASGEAWK